MSDDMILAYLVATASALVFYLGAPNQAFLESRLSKPLSLGVGFAGLVTALGLFNAVVSPLVAVFMVFIVFMTAWSLLPFIGAVLRPSQGRAK